MSAIWELFLNRIWDWFWDWIFSFFSHTPSSPTPSFLVLPCTQPDWEGRVRPPNVRLQQTTAQHEESQAAMGALLENISAKLTKARATTTASAQRTGVAEARLQDIPNRPLQSAECRSGGFNPFPAASGRVRMERRGRGRRRMAWYTLPPPILPFPSACDQPTGIWRPQVGVSRVRWHVRPSYF